MADVAALRATCPTCETAFTMARLGLGTADVAQQSTIKCPVCGIAFDCIVEQFRNEIVIPAPRWRIWNQTPTTTVTTTLTIRSLRRPQ